MLNLINFAKLPITICWALIVILLNVLSLIQKKSVHSLVALILSVAFLIMHVVAKSYFINGIANLIFDFATMIISISIYLYINDIESRREVVSEVFKNRYKKNKKEEDK